MPFWLEAWNGGSYQVERVERGSLFISYLLVGVLGGLQPDKVKDAFCKSDDGLYGRSCSHGRKSRHSPNFRLTWCRYRPNFGMRSNGLTL